MFSTNLTEQEVIAIGEKWGAFFSPLDFDMSWDINQTLEEARHRGYDYYMDVLDSGVLMLEEQGQTVPLQLLQDIKKFLPDDASLDTGVQESLRISYKRNSK